MKTIQALRILVLSALLLPALAAGDSHNTFAEELSVPDALHLAVNTGSGSIDIDTGPAGSVSVVGKVKVSGGGLFSSGGNTDKIIRAVVENPPIELSGDWESSRTCTSQLSASKPSFGSV